MNLRKDFLALLGISAFVIADSILGTQGEGSTFFDSHGVCYKFDDSLTGRAMFSTQRVETLGIGTGSRERFIML